MSPIYWKTTQPSRAEDSRLECNSQTSCRQGMAGHFRSLHGDRDYCTGRLLFNIVELLLLVMSPLRIRLTLNPGDQWRCRSRN